MLEYTYMYICRIDGSIKRRVIDGLMAHCYLPVKYPELVFPAVNVLVSDIT